MSFRQEPVRNGAAYMDFGDGTETRVHPMTCICGCNLDVTVDPWTCPECGWQQGGDPRDARIAELTAERDMLAKALQQACRVAQFTEGTGEYTGDCAGWLYADDGCELIVDVPELAAYLRQKQAPTGALTTPKEDSNGN